MTDRQAGALLGRPVAESLLAPLRQVGHLEMAARYLPASVGSQVGRFSCYARPRAHRSLTVYGVMPAARMYGGFVKGATRARLSGTVSKKQVVSKSQFA
ncbi:hypothetical protein GCM10027612_02360 [Microbispora bryophytorum subsp. camponoti]